MASELAQLRCIPCRGGVPPLKGSELQTLLAKLGGDWRAVDEHHLEKVYHFNDFKEALAFANAVGEIAEREGHHPDMYVAWGKVTLTIWTHKVDGLTESDFVLAAKADEAFNAAASDPGSRSAPASSGTPSPRSTRPTR